MQKIQLKCKEIAKTPFLSRRNVEIAKGGNQEYKIRAGTLLYTKKRGKTILPNHGVCEFGLNPLLKIFPNFRSEITFPKHMNNDLIYLTAKSTHRITRFENWVLNIL